MQLVLEGSVAEAACQGRERVGVLKVEDRRCLGCLGVVRVYDCLGLGGTRLIIDSDTPTARGVGGFMVIYSGETRIVWRPNDK